MKKFASAEDWNQSERGEVGPATASQGQEVEERVEEAAEDRENRRDSVNIDRGGFGAGGRKGPFGRGGSPQQLSLPASPLSSTSESTVSSASCVSDYTSNVSPSCRRNRAATDTTITRLTEGFTALQSPRVTTRSSSPPSGSSSTSTTRKLRLSVDRVQPMMMDKKVPRRCSEDRHVHHYHQQQKQQQQLLDQHGLEDEDAQLDDDQMRDDVEGDALMKRPITAPLSTVYQPVTSPIVGRIPRPQSANAESKRLVAPLPPPIITSIVSSTGGTSTSSNSSATPNRHRGGDVINEESHLHPTTAGNGSNGLKRRRALKKDLRLVVDVNATPASSSMRHHHYQESRSSRRGGGLDEDFVGGDEDESSSKISQVLDFLYIGNLQAVQDKQVLTENGITAVINCASRGSGQVGNDKNGASDFHDLLEMTLYLRDRPSQDISSTFFNAIQLIEQVRQNGGRVLVYCVQGKSRSPSIVMAYLIWKYKWSYSQALTFLKEKRPEVCPNIGFGFQLISWANLRPSVAESPLLYRVQVSDSRSSLSRSPNVHHGALNENIIDSSRLALACGPVTEVSKTLFLPSLDQQLHNQQKTASSSSSSSSNKWNKGGKSDENDGSPRCWLLVCPESDCQFIWYEKQVPKFFIEAAHLVSQQLIELESAPTNVVPMEQGSENSIFWNAVAHASSIQHSQPTSPFPRGSTPISSATGRSPKTAPPQR